MRPRLSKEAGRAKVSPITTQRTPQTPSQSSCQSRLVYRPSLLGKMTTVCAVYRRDCLTTAIYQGRGNLYNLIDFQMQSAVVTVVCQETWSMRRARRGILYPYLGDNTPDHDAKLASSPFLCATSWPAAVRARLIPTAIPTTSARTLRPEYHHGSKQEVCDIPRTPSHVQPSIRALFANSVPHDNQPFRCLTSGH